MEPSELKELLCYLNETGNPVTEEEIEKQIESRLKGERPRHYTMWQWAKARRAGRH